jgi:hypothetical protein
LAKPRVKESRMRVKKRVKRRVKKGVKRVKSAPPEAYLAGAGVLVGGAAMVLLATTKSGRELLIRTVQLTLLPQAEEPESQEPDVPDADKQESQEPDVPDADKQESQEPDVPDADKQESQESDAREDVDNEPAEDAEAEGEPEEDSNGDDESRVTDLKPRDQRPRSAAPGRHPRSPRKAPAPAEG